jgi:hypothetical protein
MTPPAPRGTLPQTAMQEQLSIAWLHMTASAAGCKLHRWDTDYDSIDITVHASARYSNASAARIDMQLKCTTQQDLLGDASLSYSLKRQNYEALVDPDRDVPAVLGVLLVPVQADAWLSHSEDNLLASSCMYYSLASEWDGIPADVASKTVHLPRANVLDVPALLDLLQYSTTWRAA